MTLTEEEFARLRRLADHSPKLLAMLEHYERSRWLGKVVIRISIWAGGAIGTLAAWKSLWPWQHTGH